MDMTRTAELLDPGDDNWTMDDSNHVFSTEEIFHPRLFFKSFVSELNDVLVMVGVLNIATKTQSYSEVVPQLASLLANNVEENIICGSEGGPTAANLETPALFRGDILRWITRMMIKKNIKFE